MRINGSPADQYNFLPSAATISYSIEYECEMARVFAGISISEWDMMPGTRQWIPPNGGRCKCDMLILYRMSNFIPSAASDAQTRDMQVKSKRRH